MSNKNSTTKYKLVAGDILHICKDILDEENDVYFLKGDVLEIKDIHEYKDRHHIDGGFDILTVVHLDGDAEYEIYPEDFNDNKIISRKELREEKLKNLL